MMILTTYLGYRDLHGAHVWRIRHGRLSALPVSHVAGHCGSVVWDWGRECQGAADLALALCAAELESPALAVQLQCDFDREAVQQFPVEGWFLGQLHLRRVLTRLYQLNRGTLSIPIWKHGNFWSDTELGKLPATGDPPRGLLGGDA